MLYIDPERLTLRQKEEAWEAIANAHACLSHLEEEPGPSYHDNKAAIARAMQTKRERERTK
jgi:hypothetical protein